MATQLEIANWGLTLIGEPRLSDLSDHDSMAEAITAHWDFLRDRAIRKQAWHCHIERATVSADSDAPAWGYDYQYTMDGDVVRVIQVGDIYPIPSVSDYRASDLSKYKIEGRKILTNDSGPLNVRWLVNSKPVGEWDASFAALLAADIAEHLQPKAGEAIARRIQEWRAQAQAEAAMTNAIEDPPEPLADDTWMAAHNA